MGRGRSRGRPRGPEEAAPHRQADLRQARRRARLRRLLLHRAEVRPRAQARPGGGGRRGVPRARVGARHLPGRFRELPRRGRREDPRPQAAGRDASALERPAVRRPHVAEVGVPVLRAARDLPPLGPRPGGDGARQRHRGGQDGTRELTESRLFSQFRAHYRFESRYCNPYSGNEKGSVENAVGFLRRNLLVPVPAFGALPGLATPIWTIPGGTAPPP